MTALYRNLIIAALVAALGFFGGWKVQGWRLAAVKAQYATFVATTKAAGLAAQKLADDQKAIDIAKKEHADNENATAIASLNAAYQRLRDQRARAHYVPAAPASSKHPQAACFDRTQLESALQRLDAEVSGLVKSGDVERLNLDTAKRWAQ